MVHSAYDSFELLNNCPAKIFALESYQSKLFLGCSDGSLRIYGPESSSSGLPDRHSQTLDLLKEPYVLEKTVAGFSKKSLIAMEVLESRELLLSLSESIAFHKLPNLETIAVITKAKGANVYSWDDRRGFLCFARQKKVYIFRHDGGGGFVEVNKFSVPDMVKSMSWCGENICLGIRKEYLILNTTSGVMSQVFSSGGSAPPLVVSLPSGDLLLGKDNIGVFVNQNGKLLREGRISWSEPPSIVLMRKAYGIALLSRYVEIRSLRVPYPLIQNIVLRNAHCLAQNNNSIIVSLDYSVYGLFLVPLGARIVQLTASGNFEEALSLCKLLPPEDSSFRAVKESSIHVRYAHSLFENGSYEEAMDHFLASQADITYVLSLYESIVLPKSAVGSTQDKLIKMDSDSSGVSLTPHHIEPSDSAKLETKKMSHNTLMALIKFLQKKRPSIIEMATAEGTEIILSGAVGDRFSTSDSSRFNKSNKLLQGHGSIPISSGAREVAATLDTALLQALLLIGQSSSVLELLKDLNYCDVKICDEILQKESHFTALLELYKCNGMHSEALKLLHQLVAKEFKSDHNQKFKPEMILEYLKPLCGTDPMLVLDFSMLVLESCPTQTIELFLTGNIPAEVVNSYLKQHAPNMQATYLEHMIAMNENEVSGNLQNEMVQIYLSEVLDWHADLSAQKKWDEKVYSPTRKKLLSSLENILGYNPGILLRRLPTDAMYEEHAILLGKLKQHELSLSMYVHKLHGPELALAYCDRVYESNIHQPSVKSCSSIYLILVQIYLNPRKSRKYFEKRIDNLVESLKYSTMRNSGHLEKARDRLGKKIDIIESAAEEDLQMTSPGGTDSISDDPIDEGASSIIMLDEVLDLLSQRGDRINGAHALKLLPRETKLQTLLPFMAPLLSKSSEAYRNSMIINNLAQSEHLQVKDEMYNQRKAVVKITNKSICCLCKKKMGNSVFAVYPTENNTLVHFVCYKDSQNTKAVETRCQPQLD